MSSSFPPLIKRWNHKTRFGIKFIDTCARRNNEIFGHSKEAENNSLIRRVKKVHSHADARCHFSFWPAPFLTVSNWFLCPAGAAGCLSPHSTPIHDRTRPFHFFFALWSFQMHSSFRILRTIHGSTVCGLADIKRFPSGGGALIIIVLNSSQGTKTTHVNRRCSFFVFFVENEM